MKASLLTALFCFGLAASASAGCSSSPAPAGTTGGGGGSTSGATAATPTTATSTTAAATPTTATATSTTATATATSTTSPTTTTATATSTTSPTTTTATSAGGATSTTATSTTSATSTCTATAAATGPVPITPDNGWVSCDTNTVGIEGAFYTYADSSGTTTITPADFTAAGADICVSGTVGQVMNDDYATTYGAGLGFNFANEDPWDAAAEGIGGVSFSISALPDITVRLIFTSGGTDYCAVIASAGANTFHFTDTYESCWESMTASPAANSITAVKWQITTDANMSYPFDFCITDLQAIP